MYPSLWLRRIFNERSCPFYRYYWNRVYYKPSLLYSLFSCLKMLHFSDHLMFWVLRMQIANNIVNHWWIYTQFNFMFEPSYLEILKIDTGNISTFPWQRAGKNPSISYYVKDFLKIYPFWVIREDFGHDIWILIST